MLPQLIDLGGELVDSFVALAQQLPESDGIAFLFS
jgi:hypothetical protein